ncbi:DNA-binding protein G5P [Serratia sp. HRI]|uniref:DNA-binding protein G5P n=1 Tax=Serratia TaxID=613 RepID=UPI001CCE1A08|nr:MULTISPECIES: DNA-binding protein G5P [Serratia]UBI64278.1 DNA-binding protein G5P [Serratia sp. HRI]
MSNLLNLETTVTGKIKRFNNSGGFYYTTIVSPAADAYSFPPVIRIKSKKSLGRIGDEITDVHCRITGYERSFHTLISKQVSSLKGITLICCLNY